MKDVLFSQRRKRLLLEGYNLGKLLAIWNPPNDEKLRKGWLPEINVPDDFDSYVYRRGLYHGYYSSLSSYADEDTRNLIEVHMASTTGKRQPSNKHPEDDIVRNKAKSQKKRNTIDFVNQVEFTGNAGRDSEFLSYHGGEAVKFSIAVWQPDRKGEKQASMWFDCVCWDSELHDEALLVEKGNRIRVKGRLTMNVGDGKNFYGISVDELEREE